MKISVKITEKDLFTFSMYNNNRGFTGFLNILFSVGPMVILVVSFDWTTMFQKFLLVGCTLLFAVGQPAMLKRKTRRQAESAGFSEPLTLTFTDEKILVEQGKNSGVMTWGDIWTVVNLKELYVLRTGPTRGYLIPKREIREEERELVEILKRNLPASKTKGLKT